MDCPREDGGCLTVCPGVLLCAARTRKVGDSMLFKDKDKVGDTSTHLSPDFGVSTDLGSKGVETEKNPFLPGSVDSEK